MLVCIGAAKQPGGRRIAAELGEPPMRFSAAVAEPRTLDHAGRLMRSSLAASF
jgi:hypothetical protein